MAPASPSYDLVSSLRVLYRRRKMILVGTCFATLVVAIASLVWPQTWRAESHILVTTPDFKERLSILSRPFDVLTYRSLLVDQSMLSTVLQRLRWLHEGLHTILDDADKKGVLLENLGLREGEIEDALLVQRTNIPKLARVIYEDAPEPHEQGPESEGLKDRSDKRVQRLRLLARMNADEIQAVYELDGGDLEDLSLFDLREMLAASVTKVIETNLETVYSRIIDVQGEFDTAAGSKMITNLWIRSFLDRVEEIARREILERTAQVKRYDEQIATSLDEAYSKYHEFLAASGIDDLKAELAAKRLSLYGVAEERSEQAGIENVFDLEQEDLPFLTERLRRKSLTRFEMQANFADAVLPRLADVQGELQESQNILRRLEDDEGRASRAEELRERVAELEAERDGLSAQVRTLVNDIESLRKQVEANEAKLVLQRRTIESLENQASAHRRQMEQANLLIGGIEEDQSFADVQGGTAVKPDKRVFPKRTLMTAIGMLVSFVLLCCFAFFLEIWPRITADTT